MSKTLSLFRLRLLVARSAVRFGAPHQYAGLIADHYMWAELRGMKTHGLERFLFERDFFAHNLGQPELSADDGPVIRINGNGGIGIIAADLAMQMNARRAQKHGFSVGVWSNAQRVAALGHIAESAALRFGQFCLIMTSTPVEAGVHGCPRPLLGINPIAYSLPLLEGPLTVDLSTTVRSIGALLAARQSHFSLPENAYLNIEGNFTTDPYDAAFPAIFGGYKGFSISLLVELFTCHFGLLPVGQDKRSKTDIGGIVVNVTLSEHGLSKLSSFLHDIEHCLENSGLRFPGNAGRLRAQEIASRGVYTVSDDIFERLQEQRQNST